MRRPRRLPWGYHPLAFIGGTVFLLGIGVAAFITGHASLERWWVWFGGGLVLGQTLFWLSYVRLSMQESQLWRMYRGGPEVVRWWWWVLWVPPYMAMLVFLYAAGRPDGRVMMGVAVGVLVGLPWHWRKWRVMKEAWERVEEEEAGPATATPGS